MTKSTAMVLGVVHLFQKPVDEKDLLKAVDKFMGPLLKKHEWINHNLEKYFITRYRESYRSHFCNMERTSLIPNRLRLFFGKRLSKISYN